MALPQFCLRVVVSNMKIIFLDVDGVLNQDGTKTRFRGCLGVDLDKIEHLNRIILETGAKIVMSSTWRRHPMHIVYLKQEMDKVNPVLSAQIIGDTPDSNFNKYRAEEIEEWLQLNPGVTQFIVIDDLDCEELDRFGNSFVKTYSSEGLTDEIATKCINILGRI